MSHQSYLLFELGYACYGISTSAVQELFFLPEVTPIPEAPAFMVGVINLRGHILPIVDLHRRLGQQSLPYQLTDSIIVVQWQTQRVGLLVNQIYEVQAIADEQIQSELVYEQWQAEGFQRFATGVASIGTTLVTLLSAEQLVRSGALTPAERAQFESYNNNGASSTGAIADNALRTLPQFCAHLTDSAQHILRSRSESLRQAIATQDTVGIPVTIVRLEGEYFGFSLETVYEFTDIRKVTPVPCCPPHVLGNTNLRGEIVTLVDISHVINLPMTASNSRRRAIVVRLDEIVAGIAVDEIMDVVYLDSTQILPAPVAIHFASDEYLQGVAPYQNKMIGIISLSKILTSGVLVVNED
ncbi:purine-binding chemotaxis protein CheW [Oscillatoria sp. FACHB-1407]|uniref:chemotaxis protein CheW n=1 Tax=Oscillatoria sp. FACHB-1407 TaxID=2692847 RepID=UPI001681E53F|nr:chemotaxis protein CheW [Oscillatoria sp. FACHB-1407]MBD2459511.1 purine-binding chemotaxis protein CheW [Oscillatoria sp. FACHB-1407]